MNIGIIANCHVLPLTKTMATYKSVGSVLGVPIHLYGTPHFTAAADAFEMLAKRDDTVVLSFLNGDGFGDYETAVLKARLSNVCTMTNIHFSGLHPDIIYLGDQNGRLQSPIGDYHSKLVVHSFVQGLSPNECLSRFNADEFEAIGFYREYDFAKTELINRDANLDIRFAKVFLDLVCENPCLYTINHPTPIIFEKFCALIADHLKVEAVQYPVEMLPNYLAHSAWWPIYEPIREFHKIKYSTPMLFKQPDSIGGRYLELGQFVDQSYAIYKEAGDRVRNMRQVVALLNAWCR